MRHFADIAGSTAPITNPTARYPIGSLGCPFGSAPGVRPGGRRSLGPYPGAGCMLPCRYLHNWNRKLVTSQSTSWRMIHLQGDGFPTSVYGLHVRTLPGKWASSHRKLLNGLRLHLRANPCTDGSHIQYPINVLRVARDEGEVGPGGLVGSGAALLPIA